MSNDVIQLRRFVVGQDIPSNTTNEFQRADISPLETRGEGILDASDIAQIRRYVVGLDSPQNAGGPMLQTGRPDGLWSWLDDLYRLITGREIRVSDQRTQAGRTVTVTVDAKTFGDETAASFTLEYDPSILSKPQISLGKGAPLGSVLTVNADQAAKGRLGILIDSGDAVSPGESQLLVITFEVADAAAAGDTSIQFTDSLATSGLSDHMGGHLSVRYVDGKITIAPRDDADSDSIAR